jgi:hypothetical protein
MLAMTHLPVLPSAMRNDVGTPVAIISQLNTLHACAPVNASTTTSRLATHDSLLLSCMTVSFTIPRQYIPARSAARYLAGAPFSPDTVKGVAE